MPLEWSHQIGRPEPGGQRQLGMVHQGAGGHRGLPVAAGAFLGPRFGVHAQALPLPQAGAQKAVGPARLEQEFDARRLIREALLKFNQGAGKRFHTSPRNHVFDFCS
jgi:hypothetical protein